MELPSKTALYHIKWLIIVITCSINLESGYKIQNSIPICSSSLIHADLEMKPAINDNKKFFGLLVISFLSMQQLTSMSSYEC